MTVKELWQKYGTALDRASRESDEAAREMEYGLCFHFGTAKQKESWLKSEQASETYSRIQTEIRQAFDEICNPVTYLGVGGHNETLVILSDGTNLRCS